MTTLEALRLGLRLMRSEHKGVHRADQCAACLWMQEVRRIVAERAA